jgi:hypothetical protein
MKKILIILLLIPSLSLGLTFKNGVQVDETAEFILGLTFKNEAQVDETADYFLTS